MPAPRSLTWLSLACGGLLVLAGCGSETAAPESENNARVDKAPKLSLEVAGCRHVTRDGICEVAGDDPITVWVNASAELVRASLTEATEVESVASGTQAKVAIGELPRVVAVVDGDRSARVRLEVAEDTAALDALGELRSAGQLDALAARIEVLREQDESAVYQARLDGWAARLAFSRGDTEETIRLYRTTVPRLLEAGRLSEAAADTFALFYALGERLHRFDEARDALDALAADLAPYPEGRAWMAYYQASADLRVGDLGAAVDQLDTGIALGTRLGLRGLVSYCFQLLGWIEGLVGHHEAARGRLADALSAARTAGPCVLATAQGNLGWARLLAVEAGAGSIAEARDALHDALAAATAAESDCQTTQLVARIRTNLAQTYLLAGELDRAADELGDARTESSGDDGLRSHLLDLEGRRLLAEGSPSSALRVFDELTARLRVAGATMPQGHLGRGRALLALGRNDEAIDAFQAAEHEVDAQLAQVPVTGGRDSFSTERSAASRSLIAAYLDRGETARALDVSRHARARFLWSLPRLAASAGSSDTERRVQERALSAYWELRAAIEAEAADAWQLPGDELADAAEAQRQRREESLAAIVAALPGSLPELRPRTVRDGELFVMLYPLEESMVTFVRQGGEVQHFLAPLDDRPAWLAPLAPLAAEAERIVLVLPGAGPGASAHDILVAGQPLVAHAPLAFALDLPGDEIAPGEGELYVLDPTNDLSAALDEASLLEGAATASATWLRGEEATHRRVSEGLRRARYFHYSGHAFFEGERWWDSGLRLAGGGRWSIADTLALRRSPEVAVLIGCETAAAAPAGAVASLGLAQAMVLRGSRAVVATSEPLGDAVALAFTEAFYGGPEEPVEARFRRAVLALRDAGHPWQVFRLLVP